MEDKAHQDKKERHQGSQGSDENYFDNEAKTQLENADLHPRQKLLIVELNKLYMNIKTEDYVPLTTTKLNDLTNTIKKIHQNVTQGKTW
jgi:hypothetical protein